jgi:hypothetical protein
LPEFAHDTADVTTYPALLLRLRPAFSKCGNGWEEAHTDAEAGYQQATMAHDVLLREFEARLGAFTEGRTAPAFFEKSELFFSGYRSLLPLALTSNPEVTIGEWQIQTVSVMGTC